MFYCLFNMYVCSAAVTFGDRSISNCCHMMNVAVQFKVLLLASCYVGCFNSFFRKIPEILTILNLE